MQGKEKRRKSPPAPPKKSIRAVWIGAGIGAVALLVVGFFAFRESAPTKESDVALTVPEAITPLPAPVPENLPPNPVTSPPSKPESVAISRGRDKSLAADLK